MRRAVVVVALCVLTALPVASEAGNLTVRLGAFLPRAESDLFADATELYTRDPLGRAAGLERSDWAGFSGGIEYSGRLARNVEIGFHVDGYGRNLDTSYRDFTRPSGDEIRQSLKLSVVPFGVTLRLGPTGRGRLAPYLAVGADLVYYEYEAFGDFIDFFDPSQPILADSFRSDGVAPGFHIAAGLRVPLGDDFSLVGEGRYQWAEDDMGGDFRLNRIDLSGASVTLGFNVRF